MTIAIVAADADAHMRKALTMISYALDEHYCRSRMRSSLDFILSILGADA